MHTDCTRGKGRAEEVKIAGRIRGIPGSSPGAVKPKKALSGAKKDLFIIVSNIVFYIFMCCFDVKTV